MAQAAAARRQRMAGGQSTPRWLPGPDSFLALWASFDIAIVGGTGVLSAWLYFGTPDVSGTRGLAILFAVVIAWLAFKHVGLHELAMAPRPLSQLRRAATAVMMTVLVVATIGYVTRTGAEISRLWTVLWLVWAILAFVATRTVISAAYARLEVAECFARRHVVFATAANLARLDSLLARWSSFMRPSETICAIFVDDPEAAARYPSPWRDLVVGSFDDFIAWRERDSVDQAVVLMPPDDHRRLDPVLERLGIIAVDVDLIAGDVDEVWARRRVSKVAGLPSVRIMTRPLDAQQRLVKRLEDIAVAGLALLILSPLLLLTAVAIRLDSPGPIFFRQRRHGFNNRTFEVLKFRTMYHRPQASSVQQATRNDPRVTRVGAILRRTSVDELPQIINVLRGEMSIVGPRPHAIEHNDHFARRIRSYLARHRVRPGITGWAQVKGFRGETETVEKMRARVEHDLFYVDNWSLAFDVRIILATFRCLIHPNAY